MTQNERSEPSSHAVPRAVTATVLAVPVLATVGVFGIPALAATSGHGAATTRVSATAAPGPQQAAALKQAALRAAATRASATTTAPNADDRALDAFFGHGYGYDDAARLAKLWHAPVVAGDLGEVKIAAGRNLLAGRPLESRPADLPTAEADTQAFARAGYGYADAVLLARLWGNDVTPAAAKVRAGDKLLHGLRPPTTPGQTASTVGDDVATQAFFANGYSYDDAVRLATLWHEPADGDLSRVKAEAGRKILAGTPLPLHR